MAQREFTMQVRVRADDETVFNAVEKMMCKQCRELLALLTVAAGSSAQKPDIRLISEDFIHGEKEILEMTASFNSAASAVTSGVTDDDDEEDRVL